MARPAALRQLVRVSSAALREMVLATVEAYQLKRDEDDEGVEIYGHIWGHHRQVGDLVVYHVESVSISSTAVGDSGEVDPNPRALELKQAVMERWYPQLMLLGDFHSHPYETLEEAMAPDEDDPGPGFEFSADDYETFLIDDVIWRAADDRPLMLVMTICRLAQVHESNETRVRANVQAFTIGEYRFWLNGSAGYLVEARDGPVRRATPDRRSTLTMDLFPAAFNKARDSLLKENFADE